MDNKKNYLNEVTTKSFLNFSIETIQTMFEMVKMVNNNQDVEYVMDNGEITSNEKENNPPEIIDDIPSKQQMVLDALKKENIPLKRIDDGYILEDTDTYFSSKYGMIFTNADNFVRMIKTKIDSNKDVICLCLREHFIQKEDKDYKIYFYLTMNKNQSDKKSVNIKIDCVPTDINKAITNQVNDCYPDLEFDQKVTLSNMYAKKMFRFNLKLDDILNTIKEKSKEYYAAKEKKNDKV